MKISVALATYNGEKFLEMQLDSLLTQTRHPDQLVITDDFSSDHSLEIAKKFQNIAPFEVHISTNTKNIGYAHNFQNAAEKCTGDVIVFCDQDDVWIKTKLAIIERTFKQNNDIFYIISNAQLVDNDMKSMKSTLWDKKRFNHKQQIAFNKGKQFQQIIKHSISTGMTTAVKKEVIKLAGPIPTSISHDMWYIPITSARGFSGKIIEDCLVRYRQHPNQLYGVPIKSGMLKKIATKLTKRIQEDQNKMFVFNELLTKIVKSREIGNNSDCIENNIIYLREKLVHLTTRSEISITNFIHKLPVIVQETVNGNYHEYSNGFISALSDLLPYKASLSNIKQ